MATTVNAIVSRALELLNVKQSTTAAAGEDLELGLRALSSLLDALQLDPQATIGRSEHVYTPSGGQQTITIGASGQIVSAPPSSIDPASFYRNNGVDRPIGIADSLEEYTAQANKAVQSLQPFIYYQRGPDNIGTIYLWPAATGTYELHLWWRNEVVTGYDALLLTTSLTLPNGYQKWLEDILAFDLTTDFATEQALANRLEKRAGIATRRIKRANFVSHQLQQPVEVPRRRVYSITTDFL